MVCGKPEVAGSNPVPLQVSEARQRSPSSSTHAYGGSMAPVRQVQVTVDCAEPERLARFWCEVLGYVLPPPKGSPAGTSSIARSRPSVRVRGSPASPPPGQGRDCISSAFPKARSSRIGCISMSGSAPGSSVKNVSPRWRASALG